MVNQYYCYCVDADFGPFFLKFCSYFPFNAKLCINGNEWAKRQAAKAGIGFTPMDNAFAAVDDVAALQAICHALGPAQIDALLRKWLARLPHPFSPADRAAGYRYDISILQAEFSLTQMLDKPVSGRIFFEQVIRDNLDLGRPDRISLIFGRSIYRGRKNHTPGTFATRVVTDGVTPSLHVLYKHTQIKQYHKHGRALRTETTINQAMDFGLGKRLTNLPALREIGYTANRRLLAVQRLSHDPITGDSVLRSACDPVIHDNGTRVAGLRLTDPRAQALLHILLIFRLHPRGFLNGAPGFGGDSILPRCSCLGGCCLPRYRRLAEPRSDHFSAFVLSNICPAALSSCPAWWRAPPARPPRGARASPRRAPRLRRGFPGLVRGDASASSPATPEAPLTWAGVLRHPSRGRRGDAPHPVFPLSPPGASLRRAGVRGGAPAGAGGARLGNERRPSPPPSRGRRGLLPGPRAGTWPSVPSRQACSYSPGGRPPVRRMTRAVLYQLAHSLVAASTRAGVSHGPRWSMTSVLYRPMMLSASALS